jgi:hypothetical protein
MAFVLNRLVGSISSNVQSIRGFRASVVYPFTNCSSSWPLLEWTESGGTDILAIFDMNEATDLAECNWIVHYRYNSYGPSGEQGRSGSLGWRVTQPKYLKMLFEVAQHLLGILGWSSGDVHRLYCDRNYQNCPEEEYSPA